MRLTTGLKIGRIFGIEIVIDLTWLAIFALVGLTVGDAFRSLESEGFPGGAWPWIAGFVTALVFFACLLMHELSHSIVAKIKGVKIRRITLFIFGGIAEMSEDVQTPGGELAMAAAGPAMSFLLCALFYLFYRVALSAHANPIAYLPLKYLFWVNLAVGIFNLLPGFPLDGGRMLRSILWMATGDIRKATYVASTAGQAVGGLIAGAGLYFLFTGNWLGGIWFVFIGFFVFRLAQAGYRQTLLGLAAKDTRVRDIMYTDIPLIESTTSLSDLRSTYFSAYRLPAFPVVERGVFQGVIAGEDLDRISSSEWDLLDAGRVARRLDADQIVAPDTTLDKVMLGLLRGEEFLLVIEGGSVLGILTREEMLRYVDTRLKLPRGK